MVDIYLSVRPCATLFRKYTADFSNRVVSIVHAFAAIYYSAVTFSSWGDMFDGIGGPNTEPQALCMAVSLSYFIYDLIYCAVVGDLESVFHHMFTIGGRAYTCNPFQLDLRRCVPVATQVIHRTCLS